MVEANSFRKRSIRQVGTRICATAMGLGVCLAPAAALAEAPAKIYIAAHKLVVTVAGVDYAAYTGSNPGCGFTVSQGTLKEWQSLIQTALLAGKNVSFDASSLCNGERYIFSVSIYK